MLVKQQLSFPERAIVSALRVPQGDFRDWTEIRGWASAIADTLSTSPRTAPSCLSRLLIDRY
jgi:menaquinone-dependent protoporphyrinogen oxidase